MTARRRLRVDLDRARLAGRVAYAYRAGLRWRVGGALVAPPGSPADARERLLSTRALARALRPTTDRRSR